MSEEISSAPITPRPVPVAPGKAPNGGLTTSKSKAPLLPLSTTRENPKDVVVGKRTPNSMTPRFLTPLGSPVRKAIRATKLDPQDAWLPITESRNGNAYYAAFHTLCSGIGVQALILPVAFTILGWTWGVICLTIAFFWQLYTLWLLVQLHESQETGLRYSRYLQLFYTTFGDKMGKIFALLPVMYLSYGTCIAIVILGGGTAELLFKIICGPITCTTHSLSPTMWFFVFTSAAVLLSQLPNLNSIAGVSLIGAITAVGYCTMIWAVSVAEGRMPRVSYNPVRKGTEVENVFSILNALGVIAFAFRGHNLILEIQATMPSNEKNPSHVPMWRGVRIAYTLVAICLFPLSIGGYWAYGSLIPEEGGILSALYRYHMMDVSRAVLGVISSFVIVNSVSAFQIYAMPMFDEMESQYTTRWKKPCPWWLRCILRVMFGYAVFFTAWAIPFLSSLAGLIGGLTLPVTLAYPCFMWLKIKKPKRFSAMWLINMGLGCSGMVLSAILVVAGVYVIIDTGITVSFFKPPH